MRAYRGVEPDTPLEPTAQNVLLAAWSIVHGFAALALDSAFDDAAAAMGGHDAFMARVLPAMLAPIDSERPS